MQTIQSIVRSEIQDFIHNPITVAQGYSFNQYENVKKTHLYLNSRFYSAHNNSTDLPLVDGVSQEEDDRIFFQVTTPRVKAVKRFFEIDNADIFIDEIDPQSELAIQFLNKDYDRFAEKHNLAEEYNKFRDPYVEYGSLVVKIHKDRKPEVIPLQRYFLDPTVERSKDSRFNTIKYRMTPKMLRDKVKEGDKASWDKGAVEEAIRKAGSKSYAGNSYEDDGQGLNQITSSAQIDVYERYGWLPENLVVDGGSPDKEVFALTISTIAQDGLKKGNTKGAEEDDQVLYKALWKGDLPIEDTHLVKTHGRWQGIGIVELLYGIQQRMNEVANQKRISMEISALHLFQTADATVLNNILTDLENGDVIKTKVQGSIAQVDNAERNLPAFESEIVTYQTQGDKLSFANDLLSGGDIASSTPATNAVIQNNNQVLVHLQDRQNFTNFIANTFIKKWVVPQLIKEMDDEHFLRIVSEPEDLLQIDDLIVDIKLWEITKNRAIYEGKVVDVLMKDDLRADLMKKLRRSGPNRYAKILQGYYKNKIGDVIVIIGNEKKDMAKIANNTLQFFNLIQNPAVLNDPVNRLFVTNYAREIGIDTARMELAFAKRETEPTQGQQTPQMGAKRPQPTQEATDPALAQVM